jgi:hypothetical protein
MHKFRRYGLITIDHAREFQQVDRLGHVLRLVGNSGDSNITVDPRTFLAARGNFKRNLGTGFKAFLATAGRN